MMICASRSTSPAVVTLGRLGDVCAAIPIAHDIYYQTGNPTPFIVSREYADILDACSYIESVIVDEPFHRLNRVIRRHQSKYKQLYVAQAYSSDEGFASTFVTQSFVTEAWNRAGMLDRFGLPLIFDRRNEAREAGVIEMYSIKSSEPYIVVHGGGVSSPYPHRHELLKALKDVPARVIDITALKLHKPQDLLAVLENASCAILADSFPLHLSYACPNLPVIALQTDKPTNWFGAPSRANWVYSWRYDETINRWDDIAAQAIMQLTRESLPRRHFQFPAGAYNASILDFNGKRLYTWRYHHKGNWETRLMGATHGGKKLHPIVLPPEYDAYSQEDARLFPHDGKPHISLTISKCSGDKPTMRDARCAVIYGELQLCASIWKVANIKQVRYGNNDLSGMEKNWTFWSQDGRLFCLYASEPEQIVLEIQGDSVIAEHKSIAPKWAHGPMRGDAIVPHDGKLVRFFHSLVHYPSRKFRYFLGSATMDSSPPFKMISVNPVPLFAGDERRPKTLPSSKPNVIFSCGAIKEGNEFVMALSRDDDSTTIERIAMGQIGL